MPHEIFLTDKPGHFEKYHLSAALGYMISKPVMLQLSRVEPFDYASPQATDPKMSCSYCLYQAKPGYKHNSHHPGAMDQPWPNCYSPKSFVSGINS